MSDPTKQSKPSAGSEADIPDDDQPATHNVKLSINQSQVRSPSKNAETKKEETPKKEVKEETKEKPKEESKKEVLKEEPKNVVHKPEEIILKEETKQTPPAKVEEQPQNGLVVLKAKPVTEEVQSANDLDSNNASRVDPSFKPGSSGYTKSSTRVSIIDDGDKPNYQKLTKRMDDMHARNNNNEKYSKWDALWRFSTGWHYCLSTTKTCDADKFGIGMVLYFRFLKFMAFFFFLAGILSVPILYFSVQAAQRWSATPLTNYKTGLYATTLGPIAEASSQCLKGDVGSTLKFQCPAGTIGKFSFFQYGRITETKAMSCDHYSYYSWDNRCNAKAGSIGAQNLETQYATNCLGQASCSITVTSDFFDFTETECKPWNPLTSTYKSTNQFYFQVLCQDINFEVASGLPASKTTVGLIIASIDCFITLLYIYFLYTIKKLEKKAIDNMMITNKPIESHTIEVKSLPNNLTVPQLRAKLWDYFEREVTQGQRKFKANVVDVQIAEPNRVLHLEAELANIRHYKVKAFRKFYKKHTESIKSPLSRDVDIEDLRKIANDVPADQKDKKKKVTKDLQALEKLLARQSKLEEQVKLLKNNEKSKAVSAFVTFEKQEQRDAMHSVFQRSPLAHFFFPLCCCGYKNDACVFEKKYLRVTDAPAPDDIIWSNVEVKFAEKFLRRFISWAFTFGFWVISFVLMTYVRNKQAEIADSLKPGYCSNYPDLTEVVALADSKLASPIGLLDCWCTDKITRVFNNDDCSYLQSKVITSNSLPFLIVVAIILVNFVLQFIFRLLSGFERHKSATTESVSRIIKIFVAQALNTGVIILIVNAKFANTTIPNILAGTYDDVSPAWFTDVAVTLLITMLINIASLPIMTGLITMINGLRRCCDRSCTSDKRKTKRKSQTAWENLYLGPEFFIEFRYAQILTVIFVCQLYCAGVPMLFVSTFFQLTMFYFLDKYFLLRVYRTPRRFDGQLQGMIVNALFFALILHLGNAVWIFGNMKIFGDSASLSVGSDVLAEIKANQAPGIFQNLISRAFQNQNLSLAALFALVVLGFIINLLGKQSIATLFELCAKKIKRNKKADVYKDDMETTRNSYYGRIKTDALRNEIKYLDKELEGIPDSEEKLKARIQGKRDNFLKELNTRLEDSPVNLNDKFQGIFSYHISHNPNYKRFFEVQGLVDNTSALVSAQVASS